MKRDHVNPESAYRHQWLALLEKNGISRPINLSFDEEHGAKGEQA
jgi:hypothetical protein